MSELVRFNPKLTQFCAGSDPPSHIMGTVDSWVNYQAEVLKRIHDKGVCLDVLLFFCNCFAFLFCAQDCEGVKRNNRKREGMGKISPPPSANLAMMPMLFCH